MGEYEKAVGGPITDAIRKAIANKIAEMIQDPQKLIVLIQTLVSLIPKDQVFAASDADASELLNLLYQADENES